MAPTHGNVMGPGNAYHTPRPVEVYTLSEAVDDTIPTEIRQQFHTDDAGRVLFFTSPPLDRPHKGVSHESHGLGHSVHYLAGRKEWLAERERKRKERDESNAKDAREQATKQKQKEADDEEETVLAASTAMATWLKAYDQETNRWIQDSMDAMAPPKKTEDVDQVMRD
jgi:chromatin structure-remodeling complex subunit RSC1/2